MARVKASQAIRGWLCPTQPETYRQGGDACVYGARHRLEPQGRGAAAESWSDLEDAEPGGRTQWDRRTCVSASVSERAGGHSGGVGSW